MSESLIHSTGIERTDNCFRYELIQVGRRLNIDPDYLASVISFESGFRPEIVNIYCKQRMPVDECATGLIQFMPRTARQLGTSVTALRGMSAYEQLQYVEKFYKPFAGRLQRVGDAYMATFMPAYVGKPKTYVLGRRDDATIINGLKLSSVYAENVALDADKDGDIEVGEIHAMIEREYNRASARPRLDVPVPLDHADTIPPNRGPNGSCQ